MPDPPTPLLVTDREDGAESVGVDFEAVLVRVWGFIGR